ncbi:MAG: hypothetical protein WCP34_06305, partial [Pseudomonadota bacterium]
AEEVAPGQTITTPDLDLGLWVDQNARVYVGYGQAGESMKDLLAAARYRLIYVAPRNDALKTLDPNAVPRGLGNLQVESEISEISGITEARNLQATLRIPDDQAGQTASVYVLAKTGQGWNSWWSLDGQGWNGWAGAATLPFYQGPLPSQLEIPILEAASLPGLEGTEVWVGYGQDPLEMLRAGQLQLLYTLEAGGTNGKCRGIH